MGYLADGFYKYGLWAATRPLTAIFIGVVFVVIGFVGFINSQTTVRTDLTLKRNLGRPLIIVGTARIPRQC
jgi:hypothetical protein